MTEPLTIPIAVDIVALTVIDHTLHALVVRRGIEPFKNHLALPGGFLRDGEQTEEAAARELEEETGLTPPGHLEQLRTYGPIGRDPRGPILSVAYLLLAPPPPAREATPPEHSGTPSTPSSHPLPPLPSTTRESWRTASSVHGPRSNTRPWPPPSAAPSSRSPSCAPPTRPSGDRPSTLAISTGKQRKQPPSSSQRETPSAREQDAPQPSTASSPASMQQPSSSTLPCADRPPQPRPRQ